MKRMCRFRWETKLIITCRRHRTSSASSWRPARPATTWCQSAGRTSRIPRQVRASCARLPSRAEEPIYELDLQAERNPDVGRLEGQVFFFSGRAARHDTEPQAIQRKPLPGASPVNLARPQGCGGNNLIAGMSLFSPKGDFLYSVEQLDWTELHRLRHGVAGRARTLSTVTSLKRAGLAASKGRSDDDGGCQKRSLDDDKGRQGNSQNSKQINKLFLYQ